MASGRGRGRGRGLLQRDPPPDIKPGGGGDAQNASEVLSNHVKPAPQQNDTVNSKDVKPAPQTNNATKTNVKEVEDMLASLKLDISDQDLKNFHQITESCVKSDKDLKAVVELVYKKCLSDSEFSKTGAVICDKLSTIEAGGLKFRNTLLSMLQVDFKNKDDIRKRSRTRFLNLFSFMCQVFGTMRTASGEVFKPLVNPVYDCVNLMLEAEENDEDELECLSLQLQSVGKDMEQSDGEKMNRVMEQARTKIIRDGSTARSRCTLLELVECYARDWNTVPNDITRFYCDTMADILSGMID